jgi:hypothetical protein
MSIGDPEGKACREVEIFWGKTKKKLIPVRPISHHISRCPHWLRKEEKPAKKAASQ